MAAEPNQTASATPDALRQQSANATVLPPPISFYALIVAARSKDGARTLFQSLIAQLVRLRHPTVRQIQPNPGDWGIDSFVGQLTDVIGIWQAKFFIDGVGSSQQQEIRESFEMAIRKAREEKYTMDAWTLCIPVSLDAKTTKWWDKWKRERETEHSVSIHLWDETVLEGLLLSPDADSVRVQYFGVQERQGYPALPLPPDVDFDEMLFIRQLNAAGITETDSAKRQFFNAEMVRCEIFDKGLELEIAEFHRCIADSHAAWETRFNDLCETTAGDAPDHLRGLYGSVMKAIETLHQSHRAHILPIALVHRLGTMHQVVDRGDAGWVRNFREIASQYSADHIGK